MTSTLVLPDAMPALLDLNQLCPAAGSVAHCALLDLPDNFEFVTFSVGLSLSVSFGLENSVGGKYGRSEVAASGFFVHLCWELLSIEHT